MRTLVVEDDAEKRKRIAQALSRVEGFVLGEVDFHADVVSAAGALRATRYELLVLDIALPPRADQDIEPDAGLRLLDELANRPSSYLMPTHIVGITAFPEVYERAKDQFTSRMLTVTRYDPSSSDWERALQARVRHIVAASDAREGEIPGYGSHLAVLCALDTPEWTSLERLPWGWQQMVRPGDHTIYYRGKFGRDGQELLVHAASIGRMGMPSAAALATKMVHAFRPRYLAMTGIAAGVRGRVNVGDVVAANPSWDYGSGKWTLQGNEPRFLAAPHQISIAPELREKLRLLAQDAAALAEIRARWSAGPPSHALRVHLGPLASGAAVLADGRTAETILEQHRHLLAIEMETFGVFAAAEEASQPRPLAFALKSVVDFADGAKDDSFQSYGAYTSAEVLRVFAERYL